jgi:cytoskeletal protein CcmA (bactofilin family)
MSAVDSGQSNERDGPDLSFLERAASRSPDIPNFTSSGRDNTSENRPRHGEGKVLTVGSGISVCGEISACDTLVVEGRVEANMTAGRSLDIARTGAYAGNADVENAVIAGEFEGELVVRGRLRIAATGRVKGSVRYGKLEVETGGELNGDVSVVAAVAAA